MKYYWVLLFLPVFLLFGFSIPDNDLRKVLVDIPESTIRWDGYKVLGSHHGSITLSSGEFLFNENEMIGGHFIMDMNSIVVEDLEGDSKERLENHLKSDDFFGVASHPYAQFDIVKVSPGSADGTYLIEGNMTIKDHREYIDFEAEIMNDNGRIEAIAKIQIDRSKFDIKYRSGSFFSNLGDRAIYDNFDLTVHLVSEGLVIN